MLYQLDNPDLQHILVCSLEHSQSFQVDKNNHICLHWFLEVENRAHMGLVSKDLLPQQVQLWDIYVYFNFSEINFYDNQHLKFNSVFL